MPSKVCEIILLRTTFDIRAPSAPFWQMLNTHQHTVAALLRVADASVVVASWLAAYWVRFYVAPFGMTENPPAFSVYAALSPAVAALWMLTFSWMRIYQSYRFASNWDEARRLLRAHGVAMLLFIALAYLIDQYQYSRLVVLYFGALAAVATVTFRMCMRAVLRAVRARDRNLRHVLAVGEGPLLESVLERIRSFPELGLRVCGVLTERGESSSVGGQLVLGSFKDLPAMLEKVRPQELIIALPREQQHHLDGLLGAVAREAVDVRVVPDLERYVTIGFQLENFEGIPLIRLNGSPHTGFEALAKRLTDIFIASVGAVIIAPVLLVIAVLIKVTSRGPILYAQERMSLDGTTFKMYKFRTMRVDAESATGAVWCKENDDRRTWIGSFLRRTSLDELPQLWNVLRGDMSIVGPRPERPVFVHQFRTQIPNYMLRHKVRAGITGWAQVNGWRGNTSLDRRIECDLFYIRNWSYLLDLKIMVMTLWKGMIHKNAY